MSNPFKFSCNEEVFVKTVNKEGMVVACNFSYSKTNGHKTKYTVAVEEDYWDFSDQVGTYMGKRYAKIDCKEEDLEEVEPIDIQGALKSIVDSIDKAHYLDSMRYAMHGINQYEPVKFYSDGINWHISIDVKIVKQCLHSWKTYEGFTSRFDYCEKCDAKK